MSEKSIDRTRIPVRKVPKRLHTFLRQKLRNRYIPKTNPRILQLALVVGVAVVSTGITTYALTSLWQAPASVTLKQPEVREVNVFWDPAAANPVTNVEWGELELGGSGSKILYIKNEGTITISLDWSSSLKEVSNNWVGDDWLYEDGVNFRTLRGYNLQPGEVLKTTYRIIAGQSAPTQTYSYTLTPGGVR